ncbi:MAG: RsmD family RNA methyltransferase [Sphingobacteriales bacterium]|nr:RsmD family RNA methyltransferase [Sphingobacteriales bacterium]
MLRIIGGKHKGYRFQAPKNNPARPTTDIAKEGLFNVLYNTFEFSAIKVLDLFGGTGSISYEFCSRGCEDVTTVELFGKNADFIKQTAATLHLPVQVVKGDVFKFIRNNREQYDVIFAGPPYPLPHLDTIPDLIFEHHCLQAEGWLILEHNPQHHFDEHPYFLQKKNYGTTIFSIFEQP